MTSKGSGICLCPSTAGPETALRGLPEGEGACAARTARLGTHAHGPISRLNMAGVRWCSCLPYRRLEMGAGDWGWHVQSPGCFGKWAGAAGCGAST